ncbi:hypothetical protein Syun_017317 [Stephania yunnanensis]|uniref:Uncharacterized protein n=1 Tax=Stephania yunnanensis TaxID=152371 RepID=A0AAP0J8A9_9MAGN
MVMRIKSLEENAEEIKVVVQQTCMNIRAEYKVDCSTVKEKVAKLANQSMQRWQDKFICNLTLNYRQIETRLTGVEQLMHFRPWIEHQARGCTNEDAFRSLEYISQLKHQRPREYEGWGDQWRKQILLVLRRFLDPTLSSPDLVVAQPDLRIAAPPDLACVGSILQIRPDLACSSSNSSDPTPFHRDPRRAEADADAGERAGVESGGIDTAARLRRGRARRRRAVADQETSSEKAEKTPAVADLKKSSPAVADLTKPSPTVADLKKPSPAVVEKKLRNTPERSRFSPSRSSALATQRSDTMLKLKESFNEERDDGSRRASMKKRRAKERRKTKLQRFR